MYSIRKIALCLVVCALPTHAQTLPPLPQKLLNEFQAYTQQTQTQLKRANSAQADKLFLQHIQHNKHFFKKLNRADQAFFKQYAQYVEIHHQTGKVLKKSPALMAREQKLSAYHLRYGHDDATDKTYYKTSQYYYTKLFGNKVSPAVRDYIQLSDQQATDTPVIYDNEVVLPYLELGKRTWAWEQYLRQYPNSPMRKYAQCQYKEYQSFFLTGGITGEVGIQGIEILNRKANEAPRLRPNIQQAWRHYQRQHPNSETSRLITQITHSKPSQKRADKVLDAYHQKMGLHHLNYADCSALLYDRYF